jgi:hypothetical protein
MVGFLLFKEKSAHDVLTVCRFCRSKMNGPNIHVHHAKKTYQQWGQCSSEYPPMPHPCKSNMTVHHHSPSTSHTVVALPLLTRTAAAAVVLSSEVASTRMEVESLFMLMIRLDLFCELF